MRIIKSLLLMFLLLGLNSLALADDSTSSDSPFLGKWTEMKLPDNYIANFNKLAIGLSGGADGSAPKEHLYTVSKLNGAVEDYDIANAQWVRQLAPKFTPTVFIRDLKDNGNGLLYAAMATSNAYQGPLYMGRVSIRNNNEDTWSFPGQGPAATNGLPLSKPVVKSELNPAVIAFQNLTDAIQVNPTVATGNTLYSLGFTNWPSVSQISNTGFSSYISDMGIDNDNNTFFITYDGGLYICPNGNTSCNKISLTNSSNKQPEKASSLSVVGNWFAVGGERGGLYYSNNQSLPSTSMNSLVNANADISIVKLYVVTSKSDPDTSYPVIYVAYNKSNVGVFHYKNIFQSALTPIGVNNPCAEGNSITSMAVSKNTIFVSCFNNIYTNNIEGLNSL